MRSADDLRAFALPPGPFPAPERVQRANGQWMWATPAEADLPGAIPFDFSPGTLATALQAEADGNAHVEFRDGEPRLVAGPVRFPAKVAL